ncbi:uncharacterized [Tachysurus ichikawai]
MKSLNEWLEPAGIIFPPRMLEYVVCERKGESRASEEIKATLEAVLEAFQVSRSVREMSPRLKQLPLPPSGGLTLPHYLHTEAGISLRL